MFTWENITRESRTNLTKKDIGKLKAKVPMRKSVITEDNNLYDYVIEPDGKLSFNYSASVMHNTKS